MQRSAFSNITNSRGDANAVKKRRIESDTEDSDSGKGTTSRLQRSTASTVARKGTTTTTTQPTGLRRPAAVPIGGRPSVTATRAPSRTAVQRAPVAKTAAPSQPSSPEGGEDSANKKRKRPAWDIKGRLQDLEEFTNTLKLQVKTSKQEVQLLNAKLEDKESTLTQVSETKVYLEQDLSARQKEMEEYSRNLAELRCLLSMEKEARQADKLEYERKERSAKALLDSTTIQLEVKEKEYERIRNELTRLTAEHEALKDNLQVTCQQLQNVQQEKKCVEQNLKDEKEANEMLRKQIDELEYKSREHENLRRKLHNTIQELKGNIRVFCRVRPPIGEERKEPENLILPFAFPENCDNKVIDLYQGGREAVTGGSKTPSKSHSFTFDSVFPPTATQGDVFQEISQLVQSALDGYNTCIFTYGQTGSGKTYTMEGPGMAYLGLEGENREQRGMIPRAVEQIFQTAKHLEEQGWTYQMEAFFLEIYNEKIRDLLKQKGSSQKPKSSSGKEKAKEDKYEIKHDPKGVTTVTNLTVVPVEAPYQVYDLLKRAAHNRATGKTNKNERSSRSHSVFQLKISGVNKITGQTATGLLNLIDLAGSERLAVSGATGDRLTETKNINTSLTHLKNVIFSLSAKNKGGHVPFRNSKLTYLLQNSLGGNSKTMMFVNISPLQKDLNESISSLRFATQVNSCDIGTARRNK